MGPYLTHLVEIKHARPSLIQPHGVTGALAKLLAGAGGEEGDSETEGGLALELSLCSLERLRLLKLGKRLGHLGEQLLPLLPGHLGRLKRRRLGLLLRREGALLAPRQRRSARGLGGRLGSSLRGANLVRTLALDHVDARHDVAPLVRSAELDTARLRLVQRRKVVRLQELVRELGEGDSALRVETRFDAAM